MKTISLRISRLKSQPKIGALLDALGSPLQTWKTSSPNKQNKIILILVASSCIFVFLAVLSGLFLIARPTSSPLPPTAIVDKTDLDGDAVDKNKREDSVVDSKKNELRESIDLFKEESTLIQRVAELNNQIEQELIEGLDREEKAAAEARRIAADEQRKKEAAAKAAQNASRDQLQTQQICERLTNKFEYLEFNNASDAELVQIQKQKKEAGCSS